MFVVADVVLLCGSQGIAVIGGLPLCRLALLLLFWFSALAWCSVPVVIADVQAAFTFAPRTDLKFHA